MAGGTADKPAQSRSGGITAGAGQTGRRISVWAARTKPKRSRFTRRQGRSEARPDRKISCFYRGLRGLPEFVLPAGGLGEITERSHLRIYDSRMTIYEAPIGPAVVDSTNGLVRSAILRGTGVRVQCRIRLRPGYGATGGQPDPRSGNSQPTCRTGGGTSVRPPPHWQALCQRQTRLSG